MLRNRSSATRSITDRVAAGLIFIFTLAIFWLSPVRQVTDSHYSILLSECLLKHRSFALDHYALPRLEPNASTRDYYVMNGNIWQLELARGHIYYYFPPGSSVLSVPFVAAASAFGVSAGKIDGTYDPDGETRIETALAAILMASLTVVFYYSSRQLLAPGWSLLIVLSGAFGTQVWSTASRGLWSHTWEVLLAGLVVFILVRAEAGKRGINPIALGSLLAWMYFVRPGASVVVVAVTVYLAVYHRDAFTKIVITGAVWFAGFVTYSWTHFGKPLPSYYQAGRLRFDLFPTALAGNLISPSRGLMIYVPVTLFVLYLLVRYREHLPWSGLVWLSIAIIGVHLVMVSGFANLWGDWWGGASYGPRYTTDIVPWFVLSAILGLKARLTAREALERRAQGRNRVEIAAGVLLLVASVFTNGRGAVSLDTWKWSQPATDKQLRSLLWDWRHPQFLAGLQPPAPPVDVPIVQPPLRIDLSAPEANQYLWYGWSGPEDQFRWTDGHEATVVFSLARPSDLLLEIKLGPFLSDDGAGAQRLTLVLNDQQVDTFSLTGGEMRIYSFQLSKDFLRHDNVLTFELPDATSPASLKQGSDVRLLGIRVEWLEIR